MAKITALFNKLFVFEAELACLGFSDIKLFAEQTSETDDIQISDGASCVNSSEFYNILIQRNSILAKFDRHSAAEDSFAQN